MEATNYAIEHLQEIQQDIREEIKLRIKQRDQYSIQLTVALSTLVAIASTATATITDNTTHTSIFHFAYRVLIAAPLVSVYFSTLILYSYRIHSLLAGYLRDEIEPELARLCEIPPEKEWEKYYTDHAVPGIRKTFFIGALWIICIISPIFIGFAENWQGDFMVPLWSLTVVYVLAAAWITKHFWKG